MRQNPIRIIRYRLEIDGIDHPGFSEVSIDDPSMDLIEYREVHDLSTVRKLTGLNKYSNITLKRGITDATEPADWQQLTADVAIWLDGARRSVVFRVQNEVGEEKTAFEIVRAWPRKYDPSDLNGTGNESAVGILELQQEGAVTSSSAGGDRMDLQLGLG